MKPIPDVAIDRFGVLVAEADRQGLVYTVGIDLDKNFRRARLVLVVRSPSGWEWRCYTLGEVVQAAAEMKWTAGRCRGADGSTPQALR
jgi:hypothetical protein